MPLICCKTPFIVRWTVKRVASQQGLSQQCLTGWDTLTRLLKRFPTLAGIGATHSAMDIVHPIPALDTNIQAPSTQPLRHFSNLGSAPLESLPAHEAVLKTVATHTNILEQTAAPVEQRLPKHGDSIPTGDVVPQIVCFY
jgi:hypothetical protein